MPFMDITKHKVGQNSAKVSILWNREGEYVQMKVHRIDEKQTGEHTFHIEHDEEVFSDALSRNEINKMIRALRRARDSAFGADA